MTMEHILPQKPAQQAEELEEVGIMGNLLFLDGKLNDKLGNKSFSDKIHVLIESGVPLDDYVRTAEAWDEARIRARTKGLSELCYQKIFRV